MARLGTAKVNDESPKTSQCASLQTKISLQVDISVGGELNVVYDKINEGNAPQFFKIQFNLLING